MMDRLQGGVIVTLMSLGLCAQDAMTLYDRRDSGKDEDESNPIDPADEESEETDDVDEEGVAPASLEMALSKHSQAPFT
jgi:hypothetical protein